MRSHPKHLGLLTATLLLWWNSSLQLLETNLGISSAMAAELSQSFDADGEQLPQLHLETFSKLNRSPFQVANILPAVYEKCELNQSVGVGTRNLGKESLKESLQRLQQQLIIHQKTGNRSGEAATLNEIGLVYICFKDYSEALNWHQQALVIYEELGNHKNEAETMGFIGNAYFKAGQYRQVEELFRQRLESVRNIGDTDREQLILEVIHRYLAKEWLFQSGYAAQAASKELDTRLRSGNISWQETLDLSQLNLFLNRQLGYREREAVSWHSIGWAYRNLAQYSLALDAYQKALAIAQEIGGDFKKDVEAFFLIDIGIVYSDLAQYDRALEFFNQSLEIKDNKQKPVTEHFALNHMGLVYKQLRQYDRALPFFQEALSKLGQGFEHRNILNNIGSVYFELGDYAKALEFYQQALKLGPIGGEPGVPGFTLNSIGLVYDKMGNYPQALETYRKAIALFKELNDRPGERTTLTNIGILLEKQNQPELAIVFYKEAVSITEAIRQDLQKLTIEEQKVYTETVADTYRRLADLLLSQGRILEAQQVLELLKIQELRDFTKDTRAGGENYGIATNPTEAEILKIHSTLIALGRKIEECQQCAERSQLLDEREVIAKEFEETVRLLEKEIRSRREQDKAFLDPSTLGGKAEEIVSAQPGTVLIYPLVLEDKLWILWAAQGGITKSIEVSEVGLKQLSETVVRFRQLLQNPTSDIAEVKATGKELYDWLIPESLQKELKENKIQNLVFSLDRVTRYIPMSAVFDGEKYLTENYNISTILSANLTQMGDRLPPGTQNTSVLALGLSDAVANFNPLPNVPQELDAIVRQSPADPQGIYPGVEFLNKAFDRRALRDNLAGHLIVHIATHGEFVPGSAYNSYLLLGNGDKLPIPDLQNLRDLNKIHLVVLSACETALGETGQDGTEIAGLSYYFLNGGAKAVMASLWQVDDESTRLLMEQFYNNLANSTPDSPITKAKALRQAQLSLIESDRINTPNTDSRSLIVEPLPGTQTSTTKALGFSHPYYWAPFILIGNSL